MIRFLYYIPVIMMINVTQSMAQVDYATEIQPIFNQNCTACHGGTSGVRLTSYNEVMNSVGDQYDTLIVFPGNAAGSPIVDKISSDNPEHGSRMPDGGPYLSQNQIDLIRDWINEGAHQAPTHTEHDLTLQGFELLGNYPNPFNPVTQVRFTLPEHSEFIVRVSDMNGRLISQISGVHEAGRVTVPLNFSGRASGIYLYEVEINPGSANAQRLGGKMMLVK